MYFPLILFPLLPLPVLAYTHDDKVVLLKEYEDDSNRKVMVITWDEGKNEEDDRNDYTCEVFTESRLIERILKHSKNPTLWRPNTDEMRSVLEKCVALSLNWRPNQEEDDQEEDAIASDEMVPEGVNQENVDFTFPGTKWCGPGNTAKNYSDLGTFDDTDRCCRTHDHCNDTLGPGESKGNITNETPTTQLSCECDEELYECLQKVNSGAADAIGYQYFNILGRSCFKFDYPASGKCKEYRSFLHLRCLEYHKDKSKPKEWQWSTVKHYESPSSLRTGDDKFSFAV